MCMHSTRAHAHAHVHTCTAHPIMIIPTAQKEYAATAGGQPG